MIELLAEVYLVSVLLMCIYRFFSKYLYNHDDIAIEILETYDYDLENFEKDWFFLTITPILNTFMSIIYTLLAIIFLFEYISNKMGSK